MTKETTIKLFEEKQVRAVWNVAQEKWHSSVVDVLSVLTKSVNPNACWRKLKPRLKLKGNETVTNYHGLKMLAEASNKDISAASNPMFFTERKKAIYGF